MFDRVYKKVKKADGGVTLAAMMEGEIDKPLDVSDLHAKTEKKHEKKVRA